MIAKDSQPSKIFIRLKHEKVKKELSWETISSNSQTHFENLALNAIDSNLH